MTGTLDIELDGGQTECRPGEEFTGTVRWLFDDRPDKVELRLFWYTRGKGDEDTGLAENLTFESPTPSETRAFRFTLPNGPYSFSGRLISLTWAVEAVAEPGDHVARVEFTLSPTGREVMLGNRSA